MSTLIYVFYSRLVCYRPRETMVYVVLYTLSLLQTREAMIFLHLGVSIHVLFVTNAVGQSSYVSDHS